MYLLEFQRINTLQTLSQGVNSQRFRQGSLQFFNFDHEQWRVRGSH